MDHHAYLIVGTRREAEAHLNTFLASAGVVVSGNPDIFLVEKDVFGVDDARDLVSESLGKAFGERRVFVIYSQKFTPDAQDALLKTLEDPIENTHFFISVREVGMLSPTLLSRLRVVKADPSQRKESEAQRFLAKGLRQRLDFALKFADEKGDRGSGALAEFIDSLTLALREDGASPTTLKKVIALRKYARDSGAMPRVILEHLALVV